MNDLVLVLDVAKGWSFQTLLGQEGCLKLQIRSGADITALNCKPLCCANIGSSGASATESPGGGGSGDGEKGSGCAACGTGDRECDRERGGLLGKAV